MRNKIVIAVVLVALVFSILGLPSIQNQVRDWAPTSWVGGKIKSTISVGLVGVVYATAPDYTVDGTDDNVQVQQALNDLPSTGGKIILYAGNYTFSATVSRAINNVTFEGSGKGTYFL